MNKKLKRALATLALTTGLTSSAIFYSNSEIQANNNISIEQEDERFLKDINLAQFQNQLRENGIKEFENKVAVSAILLNIESLTKEDILEYIDAGLLNEKLEENLEVLLDLEDMMINYYVQNGKFPADYKLLVEDERQVLKLNELEKNIEQVKKYPTQTESVLDKTENYFKAEFQSEPVGVKLVTRPMMIPLLIESTRHFVSSELQSKIDYIQEEINDLNFFYDYCNQYDNVFKNEKSK